MAYWPRDPGHYFRLIGVAVEIVLVVGKDGELRLGWRAWRSRSLSKRGLTFKAASTALPLGAGSAGSMGLRRLTLERNRLDRKFSLNVPGFDLVRRLGSGGFGDVWLADQIGFDRQVAIKVAQSPLRSADEKLRFERECQALGRLSGNPNIVGVYTSGFVDGELPYLVMEYIDGGTLKSRSKNLEEPDLRKVASQLCLAIQSAHDLGVLHRDLKPENVFLRRNGDAVVGDFGIARVAEKDKTSQGVPATLLYVAPEILEGREAAPVSDVYGIGVTVASAMLGRSPFDTGGSNSQASVISRVLNHSSETLAGRGFSEEFVAVVERAMARNPDDRPKSAKELHAQLERLSTPGVRGSADGLDASQPAPPSPVPESAPPNPPSSIKSRSAAFAGAVVEPEGFPPDRERPLVKSSRFVGSRSMFFGLLAVAAALVFVGGAVLASNVSRSGEVQSGGSAPASSIGETTTSTVTDLDPVTGDGSSPDGPGQEMGSTTTEGTQPDPREQPLALPLQASTARSIVSLEDGGVGFVADPAPADVSLFCGEKPTIGGLEQTLASTYRPQKNYVLVQRISRFASEQDAANYVLSFPEIAGCGSWLSGPRASPTFLDASVTEADQKFGDQIVQVDERARLPSGVTIYSRVVIVRSGEDVIFLSYSSPIQGQTETKTASLLGVAVSNAGF